MATITNPYDALYTNLKNAFTVEYKGAAVTVADFLLAKAGKGSVNNTALTVTAKESGAIVNVLSYVNDKLTMKVAPQRDETMTRFPVRTSASAIMSAVAACAMVMGCAIFAIGGRVAINNPTVNGEDSSFHAEDQIQESELQDEVIYE